MGDGDDLGKVIFFFEMSGDELDRRHGFPRLRRQRQRIVIVDAVLFDNSAVRSALLRYRGPLVADLSRTQRNKCSRSHRIHCHAEISILNNECSK